MCRLQLCLQPLQSNVVYFLILLCSKYARDMQNHVNLTATIAFMMLLKFLLQQFVCDQQVLDNHKVECIHCLFGLNNQKTSGFFGIAHPLHYIVVGG